MEVPHLSSLMIIASPLLLWNMKYDFITWRFHSERVDISEALQDKDSFLTELLGQVLVNNPVNFLLIGIALVAAYRSRRKNPPTLTAYNYVALPKAGTYHILKCLMAATTSRHGPGQCPIF